MNCRPHGTYPADWPAISRAAKAATGWRCERCGHPDDPAIRFLAGIAPGCLPCDGRCTHPPNGKRRMLTVHHLDGDKGNCEPHNLASLCQACHLSIQARVCWERPYFLPHTPWMARHVEAHNAWAAERGLPTLPLTTGGDAL